MKPKGKWKYADRIGLISLGYFNELQNNFRDWTFKFFDKQRKKVYIIWQLQISKYIRACSFMKELWKEINHGSGSGKFTFLDFLSKRGWGGGSG